MLRRLFLALPLSKTKKPDVVTAPTDETRMNDFVKEYNTYVGLLRLGQVDLRAWKRTAQAWGRLTHSPVD